MNNALSHKQPCPCNANNNYSDCCQPYHLGKALPNNAEQLMRSRYSAYVLQLTSYIKNTWHPTTYPDLASQTDLPIKWMNLVIHKAWPSEQNNEAFVEFTAHYKINGKAEKLHEISRFVLENNKWIYIDGKLS